ncbi:MAG: NERD domain-containing protein [Clostridiales bacterium]|nr:NERD domain-containing protein [Clostridiales bacterium]
MQFQDYFTIIIFFLLAFFLGAIYPKCKGWFGEKTVDIILSTLPQEQYQILNNVMLCKKDGKTTQIDHIVISLYGIFVIETKNYRGYITGSVQGEKWTQNKKYTFYNPLKQNYGHMKTLAELLELTEDMFIPIVVFSTGANVKVQSKKIVYTTQLRKAIRSYKSTKLSTDQMYTITNKIKNSNIHSKNARKDHIKAIHQDVIEREHSIAKNICPRCGSKLVERRGKYGLFMGCSSYPRCRFTINL